MRSYSTEQAANEAAQGRAILEVNGRWLTALTDDENRRLRRIIYRREHPAQLRIRRPRRTRMQRAIDLLNDIARQELGE